MEESLCKFPTDENKNFCYCDLKDQAKQNNWYELENKKPEADYCKNIEI